MIRKLASLQSGKRYFNTQLCTLWLAQRGKTRAGYALSNASARQLYHIGDDRANNNILWVTRRSTSCELDKSDFPGLLEPLADRGALAALSPINCNLFELIYCQFTTDTF